MSGQIRDYLWPYWVDKGQPAACSSQLITRIWGQGRCPSHTVKVSVWGLTVTRAGPPVTTEWLTSRMLSDHRRCVGLSWADESVYSRLP